jgi:hypothetical protein
MLSMSLYLLGPAALGLALVIYVVERGPIIAVRWLWCLIWLDAYRHRSH